MVSFPYTAIRSVKLNIHDSSKGNHDSLGTGSIIRDYLGHQILVFWINIEYSTSSIVSPTILERLAEDMVEVIGCETMP